MEYYDAFNWVCTFVLVVSGIDLIMCFYVLHKEDKPKLPQKGAVKKLQVELLKLRNKNDKT